MNNDKAEAATPDERLAAIERDLAARRRRDDDALRGWRQVEDYGVPPAPGSFKGDILEAQTRARLERVEAAQRQAEADRLQAEKDVPKRAKREREAAALSAKYNEARATAAAAATEADRAYVEMMRGPNYQEAAEASRSKASTEYAEAEAARTAASKKKIGRVVTGWRLN